MKTLIVLCFIVMVLYSCDNQIFPIFPKKYSRIYNSSGKTLQLSILERNVKTQIKQSFENNDSLEYRTQPSQSIPFNADSIFVVFDDGKKLSFKNYENVAENFFSLSDSFTPKKGKYKNSIITRYYIKPIHYELAK